MKISAESARRLCQRVFAGAMRAAPHVARVSTQVLVEANLRGIDSHGIQVLPYYLDKWKQGQIVPDAELAVVRATETTLVLDAHHSLGHYASLHATDESVRRAMKCGLGAAVVRCSTHNGAISHYTIHAARQGVLAIAATACAPHVAPHGGAAGLHGTNPISYAFCRGSEMPLVFDVSTGHSAAKMKEAVELGGKIPDGWLLDAAGRPSNEPGALGAGGWILPVAGHIGYGLGLLVDGLTAALADSPIGRQMPLVSETSRPYEGSFFVLAISPDAFGGRAAFERRIGELVRQIEAAPARDPDRPVRWPGERGWRERRRRVEEGIPVQDAAWNHLVRALNAHGIDVEALRVG